MTNTATDMMTFATNHWGLCLIFLFSFAWVVTLEMQARLAKGVAISPQAVTRYMNDDDALVIDMRSEKEFAAGHLLSSQHIAANQLTVEHKSLKNVKDTPVIVVCDYGVKATKLANQLRKDGISQVYSLAGGMEAWKKAELPIVSK